MSRDTVIVSKCQNIIGSTYTNIITASMGPKLFIYARYNIRESKIDRRDWYTANQITVHPSTNQVTDGRNMERFHTKTDRFCSFFLFSAEYLKMKLLRWGDKVTGIYET